ncbi:glycosyltransferase [Apibacter sp. HY039]|uniref:glycosyltransferase family 2 protein n=1 Tax=Apibacter sp. HY039 TaxID=2501476 RepID=UPI000FEBDE18|nr:glycosyltransferase [Apibacter sp. HY039]
MISILIPVFNYSVKDLIIELKKQAIESDLPIEILVFDDCSTDKDISLLNKETCEVYEVSYVLSEQNVGNAKARNFLVGKSTFSWLLFIDADMFPVNKDFLFKYIESTVLSEDVICGDVVYKNEVPYEGILRWKYGRTHEQVDFNSRIKNPHLMFRLNCFMIKKDIYLKYPFPELNETYGYTDIFYSSQLKKNGITVRHIENPMYHLGLESNEKFLFKTEKAVRNLAHAMHEGKDISLIKLALFYIKIKRLYLDIVLRYLYKISYFYIRKNLLSKSPSILLFQFYKLGYLSELLARK